MSREQYIGVTNSFSVEASLSHCGDQMCSVTQVCDSSQISQIQACWLEMKSLRKSPSGHSQYS